MPTEPQPSRFIEPAHDLLRVRRGPMDVFIQPHSIVLVGATEATGSVGATLAVNLLAGPFAERVWLVNPKHTTLLGKACYPSVAELPMPADLALIAVPAAGVPGVIEQCQRSGVNGAIIISAGFKEIGPAGAELEAQIVKQIAGTKLRVIGPNCVGVMSPVTGLNATFAKTMAHAGKVAFISQSGALLTAILDWSLPENVGFSHIFSVGSMLDVGWGDLIDFLGDDPHTTSIVIYMESVGNAKSFLSAAREVSLQKPIIVIKAGRSEKAAKAAASHTGALAGSDEVLEAAFRRVGVLRVRHLAELFHLAEVLDKQPRPVGPNLAIVTNAGGPAVLATDALIEAGGQLATLSEATLEELNTILPAHWSHGNPVDVIGDAAPQRYVQSVGIVGAATETDGVLAILAPQAMTEPTETAQLLTAYNKLRGKPILASWMGAEQVAAGMRILHQAGIPTFSYPETAARVFQYMWHYSDALKSLYETPSINIDEQRDDGRRNVANLIRNVLWSDRTLLTEAESKQLLAAYDIPTVKTLVATNVEEALQCAQQIGYPVVLKLISKTITHKSDVGGVRLNLQSDEELRGAYAAIQKGVERAAGPGHFDGVSVQPMIKLDGYELILGSKIDAQFGPVILFGAGGQFVEVFQDHALALPPLTSTLARRMMERTKVYRALQGVRGRPPVNLLGLEQLLVRFAQLVLEQPRIAEIDINPLLASDQRLIALDARVVLHPKSIDDLDLPQPVIRPYPRKYVSHWTAKDGRRFKIRPVRPEDEPLFVEFHRTLSVQTVYGRYAQVFPLSQRTVHERLSRMCFVDYDRQIPLVAIEEESSPLRLAAVARLIKLHGRDDAEFALVVSDDYQHISLGSELMARLVDIAKEEHLKRLIGQINADNVPMLSICRRLGFRIEETSEGAIRMAVLEV